MAGLQPEILPEEIFRIVFAETNFPLLSADTVALAGFLANPRTAEGCHLIQDFYRVHPTRAEMTKVLP